MAEIRGEKHARPNLAQRIPVRTSTIWRIHWLTIEPTLCRYQQPVNLARLLAEHHAAVAAEPIGD